MPKIPTDTLVFFEKHGVKRSLEENPEGEEAHKRVKKDSLDAQILHATRTPGYLPCLGHPECTSRASNIPRLDKKPGGVDSQYFFDLPCSGKCRQTPKEASITDASSVRQILETNISGEAALSKEEVPAKNKPREAALSKEEVPAKTQPGEAKEAEKSPMRFPAKEMEKSETTETMDNNIPNPDTVTLATLMEAIKASAATAAAQQATAAAQQEQQTKDIKGIAESAARSEDMIATQAKSVEELEARMIERETKAHKRVMDRVNELEEARRVEMAAFKEEVWEQVRNITAQVETNTNSSNTNDAHRAFLLKEVREARFKVLMHGYRGRTGLEGVKAALKEMLDPSEEAWEQMKVIQVHRLGPDPKNDTDRANPVVIQMGSIADAKKILEQAASRNRAGGIFIKKFIPQDYMHTHSEFISYGMSQRNLNDFEWDVTFCDEELQLFLRKRPNRITGRAPGEWFLQSSFIPPAKPAKIKEERTMTSNEYEDIQKVEATTSRQILLNTDRSGKVLEPDMVAGEVLGELRHLVLFTHPPGEILPEAELPQSWNRGQILLTCRCREDAKELTAAFQPRQGKDGRRVGVQILLPDSVMTTKTPPLDIMVPPSESH